MLVFQAFLSMMFLNLLLMCLWNLLIFAFSVFLDKSIFKPEKNFYQPKSWEKSGKFYSKTLKIKIWKDILPQHIGKNGFSKRHLTDTSLEYINEFILETCRSEWNHFMCCAYAVFPIFFNPLRIGIIFSLLAIFTNIPFLFIQRYNRFRLTAVKKRLLRYSNKNESTNFDAIAESSLHQAPDNSAT